MADRGDRLFLFHKVMNEIDRLGQKPQASGLMTPPGSTKPSKSSGDASERDSSALILVALS